MSIYKVNSKLNYSGEIHEAGSFIELADGQETQLVEIGTISPMEGAQTFEEAAAIAAEQDAAKADAEAAAKAAEKPNTWGPQPEQPPVPEPPVKTDETQPAAPAGSPVEVGQGDVPPAPNAGDNL